MGAENCGLRSAILLNYRFYHVRDIMKHSRSISAFRHLVFFLALCLLPAVGLAAVVIESYRASGTIVQILGDNSVKLDDGVTYTPAREDLVVTVQAGQPVTLLYGVNAEGKNIFFDFAPGLNSLQRPAQVTEQVNDNSAK